MTEQNMQAMLQEMLATRVSEAVQSSLFPHELEVLVNSGLDQLEGPDEMNEQQEAMVKAMYDNHIVMSSDLDDIRSLHLMQIGSELYALRNPDDINQFRDSLDQAREIFDAKEAAGENEEERSPMLDLTIKYAGRISEDQIEKVQANAFIMLDIVVLPAKIEDLA